MKTSAKLIYGGIIGGVLAGGLFFHLKPFSGSKKVIVEKKISQSTQVPEVILQESTDEGGEVKKEEETTKTSDPASLSDEELGKEGTSQTTKKEDSSDDKADEENDDEVETGLVSFGHSSGRSASVDTIIVHSVYNKLGGDRYSFGKILDIFKDYGVAPHYIIERDGDVHQLVKESDTAWHAGTSQMPDGRTNANNFSIGIELINAEDDEPESAQYKSLDKLIDQIKSRHQIKHLLGHSDVAEGRKTDPWNFDWDEVGGKKK